MISGNITLLQGKVGLEPCTQKSGCQMPFSLNRVVRKHTVTLNFCGLVQYVVGKHQYFPPCYVFVFFFRLPGNRYSMLWRSESRKSLWVIPNHHCGLVWTVCEQILSTQGSGSTIFIYCATSLSVPFFSVPITRLLLNWQLHITSTQPHAPLTSSSVWSSS